MLIHVHYPTGFIVLFSDAHLRDHALDYTSGIDLGGGSKLRFIPWTRMTSAKIADLQFKMRLCIEGVPPHARQLETLKVLFDPNTLIESIDQPNSDTEAACCSVKLWTSNSSGFAKEGSLRHPESLRRGIQCHFGDQPGRTWPTR